MAIKERKQITGTEAQIKGYAGHNGTLAYATDTKHLHVLSGTAGTTTKLANMSDIPAPVDISGKADKTYVDTQLATKQPTGDYATTTELTTGLAGKANAEHSHAIADVSGLQTALDGKLDTTGKAQTAGIADTANALAASAKVPYSQLMDAPSIPNISVLVPKTGNRGTLGGYETLSSEGSKDMTVYDVSLDTYVTSGAVSTSAISSYDDCWTKVIALISKSPSVTLAAGWVWEGGKPPTLKQYDLVVFNKIRGLGTATHIPRS